MNPISFSEACPLSFGPRSARRTVCRWSVQPGVELPIQESGLQKIGVRKAFGKSPANQARVKQVAVAGSNLEAKVQVVPSQASAHLARKAGL